MIGKTIVAVDEPEEYYGDEMLLRFSDGSAALLQASGYEDASLSVTELDPEALAAREAELARERAEREERDRVNRERNDEVRRMRESLPAPEFEAWMDEHRPRWREQKMMHEMYVKTLQRQLDTPLFLRLQKP